MLNWIKKIIKGADKKEDVPYEYDVVLEHLDEWFDKKTAYKSSQLNYNLKEIFSSLNEGKQELCEKLDALEKSKLQNPNLFVKEMQVMEGNRLLYLKKLRQFVDDLKISEITPESALEFRSAFEKSLNDLNKSTFRSFQVLQYFFANEVQAIASKIRKIDEIVSSINQAVEKSGFGEFRKIKAEIKEMKTSLKAKKELENELMLKEKHFAETNRARLNFANEIEKLKASPEFSELSELKLRKENLEKNLRKLKNDILQKFISVDKVLKKMRLEDEQLIKKYLSDPASALAGDTELKIAGVLEDAKNVLGNNAFDIDEKRKSKILDALSELNTEKLKEFINSMGIEEENISILNKKISIHTASTAHSELQFKINSLNDKSSLLESELKESVAKLSKINFDQRKENLQNRISSLLNAKVAIKND